MWADCPFKEHCFNPRWVGGSLEEPYANSCGPAAHFGRGGSIHASTCIGFLGVPWGFLGPSWSYLGALGVVLGPVEGTTTWSHLAYSAPLRRRPPPAGAACGRKLACIWGFVGSHWCHTGACRVHLYVSQFVCLLVRVYVYAVVCMYIRTYVRMCV